MVKMAYFFEIFETRAARPTRLSMWAAAADY
jgi:hypothetical protein